MTRGATSSGACFMCAYKYNLGLSSRKAQTVVATGESGGIWYDVCRPCAVVCIQENE